MQAVEIRNVQRQPQVKLSLPLVYIFNADSLKPGASTRRSCASAENKAEQKYKVKLRLRSNLANVQINYTNGHLGSK